MVYERNERNGFLLGDLPEEPIERLAALSEAAAREGIVLLKNENGTLPFGEGERIAIWGRIQNNYYKSGTGSGGLVNVTYLTNIPDALRKRKTISVNEELASVYREWEKEHPFDVGHGWASEPWCQEEMEVTAELVGKIRKDTDKALIVIGRTAGEDKDNSASRGSYLLTEKEEDLIAKVTEAYDRVCVVLNVGAIIDMSFVERYGVEAVLYGWQGGQRGGEATAAVLCGECSPSGKLPDTIATSLDDYPSSAHFGDPTLNAYAEDIYVGYRYFETFAPEKVVYPFGFGLSYTTFAFSEPTVSAVGTYVNASVTVTNTGDRAGKEVAEWYLGAPNGVLGKPEKVLCAFMKTVNLAPGQSETLKVGFDLADFASYDDSGATGNRSAYVLEAGQYLIYVGSDVRSAEPVSAVSVEETTVVRQCVEALSPVTPFERLHRGENGEEVYENVPVRTYDINDRIASEMPAELIPIGGMDYKLTDVKDGKCTMEAFVAQLSDDELVSIVLGEGMNSPKVTGGTGCAFAGVTDALVARGIPVACGTDGPSGIRMDTGAKATAMPNGTLLAATFNLPLVSLLYEYEGIEMTAYKIDTLLGPGINIHRNPQNGRNFEYFSEDPYLTGKTAAAIIKAFTEVGVMGTIKHFAGNEQEFHRHDADSVMSERAAREIYLKPFEIAVREGGAKSIMTSYNPINGTYASNNYDLTTTILRGEWGYDGFVMTDWWANLGEAGAPTKADMKTMVRAQNDIYMVTSSALTHESRLREALAEGTLTRAELQRNACNICRFAMNTHAMERFAANGCTYEETDVDVSGLCALVSVDAPKVDAQNDVEIPESGKYVIALRYRAGGASMAQIPIRLELWGRSMATLVAKGTDGGDATVYARVSLVAERTALFIRSDYAKLDLCDIKFYKM